MTYYTRRPRNRNIHDSIESVHTYTMRLLYIIIISRRIFSLASLSIIDELFHLPFVEIVDIYMKYTWKNERARAHVCDRKGHGWRVPNSLGYCRREAWRRLRDVSITNSFVRHSILVIVIPQVVNNSKNTRGAGASRHFTNVPPQLRAVNYV